MKSKCCICDKELEGVDTFGPLHFPACYPHYVQFSDQLYEIESMPHSTKQDIEILVLRGNYQLPPHVLKVKDLEKKIQDWEDEVDFLKSELYDYNYKIRNARDEISKLQRAAVASVQAA